MDAPQKCPHWYFVMLMPARNISVIVSMRGGKPNAGYPATGPLSGTASTSLTEALLALSRETLLTFPAASTPMIRE